MDPTRFDALVRRLASRRALLGVVAGFSAHRAVLPRLAAAQTTCSPGGLTSGCPDSCVCPTGTICQAGVCCIASGQPTHRAPSGFFCCSNETLGGVCCNVEGFGEPCTHVRECCSHRCVDGVCQ
jgi:hypothetical protein